MMLTLLSTLYWRRTHLRALRWCVVATLLVWSDMTFGQATCWSSSEPFTILPPATISVPRDKPNGSVLWIGPNQNKAVTWSCNLGAAQNSQYTLGSAASLQIKGASSGYTTNAITGGGTYTVVQTDVAGVGIAAGTAGYLANPSSGSSPGWSIWRDTYGGNGWNAWAPVSTGVPGPNVNMGNAFQIVLVKIGDIRGGTLPATTVGIATAICNYYPWGNCGGGLTPMNYNMTAVTFTQAACTTPDVTVALGKHSSTEFTGPGSTTSAVSFNINVNACPAGMNSVKYRIDPATTVVDQSRSVVALDKSSSATGVGIQLLKADGTTALPLATVTATTGYNATSGGNFQIPLMARYYQTGASVGPGPANTTMTFTMSYQ